MSIRKRVFFYSLSLSLLGNGQFFNLQPSHARDTGSSQPAQQTGSDGQNQDIQKLLDDLAKAKEGSEFYRYFKEHNFFADQRPAEEFARLAAEHEGQGNTARAAAEYLIAAGQALNSDDPSALGSYVSKAAALVAKLPDGTAKSFISALPETARAAHRGRPDNWRDGQELLYQTALKQYASRGLTADKQFAEIATALGQLYLNNKRFPEAEVVLKSAMDFRLKQTEPDDQALDTVSSLLVQAQSGQQKQTEAQSTLKTILSRMESRSGAESLKLVPILCQLGRLDKEGERLDSPQHYMLRAVNIADQHATTQLKHEQYEEARAAANSLDGYFNGATYGNVVASQSPQDKDLLEKALKSIYKLKLITNGLDYSTFNTLGGLGRVLSYTGKKDEVVTLYKGALDYAQKDTSQQGIAQQIRSMYLESLKAAGQDSQAEAVKAQMDEEQRAKKEAELKAAADRVAQAQKSTSKDPTSLASSLLNLSTVEVGEKKQAEAVKHFKEALALYEEAPSTSVGPQELSSLWNSLNQLMSSGEVPEPLALTAKLITLSEEKRTNMPQPMTLSWIEPILQHYQQARHYAEPAALLTLILNQRDALRGKTDPSLLDVLRRLKPLCLLMNDQQKAMAADEWMVQIAETQYPKDSPQYGQYALDLCVSYIKSGKLDQANQLLPKVIAALQSSKQPNFPGQTSLASAYADMAQAYLSQKQNDLADKCLRSAVSNGADPRNLSGTSVVDGLINLYRVQNQFEKAESLLSFVIDNETKASRADSAGVNQDRLALSELYLLDGKQKRAAGKAAEAATLEKQSDDLYHLALAAMTKASGADSDAVVQAGWHREHLLQELEQDTAASPN